MFANPEIPLESLPQAERIDWQALHPDFATCQQIRRTGGVLLLAVLAAGIYVLAASRGLDIEPLVVATVAAGAALLAILYIVWPLVDVPRRGYAVRDKDIAYRAGVLWRTVQVVPFNRVQHATTKSGPMERGIGLATLTVFTAGGSGGDLRIAGLGKPLAESLRTHIVGKLGGAEQPPAAT